MNEKPEPPADKLGRTFYPGQLVAYPYRQASTCELKLAELLAVRHDGTLSAQNAQGRRIRLKKLSEVCIVTHHCVVHYSALARSVTPGFPARLGKSR